MRAQKQSTKNKTPLIILLTIGIIGLATLGYLLIAKPFNNTIDNSPDSNSNQQGDDKTTTGDKDTPPVKDDGPGTGSEQPQPNPSEQSSTATINLPSYQASGDTISVNVAISETWGSSAKCTMQIEGTAKRTVQESVFAQAQISGCLLEASGLPSGNYTVSVYAENNGERTNTKVLRVAL